MNLPTEMNSALLTLIQAEIKHSSIPQVANDSQRLIANNKARALQLLQQMTKQLEANTVVTITSTKGNYNA